MRHLSLAVIVLSMVVSQGCRSQQLAHDQDTIRSAVMQLHENQIMDNLVRAKKGLPILHLDYLNMTGTITQTGNASGGGSQQVASNSFLSIPASAAAISRTLTDFGEIGASATQVNQLTITAQPVNSPEVYSAYLDFLENPDRLRATTYCPNSAEALIVRCYDADFSDGWKSEPTRCIPWPGHKHEFREMYYWVPKDYADDFRRLSIYAVAVRGQPVVVSQNFEATVLGVIGAKKSDEDVYELFVKIDSQIPNDRGYMVAVIGGKLYEDRDSLKVLVNTTGGLERAQPGTVLEANQQTDVVRVSLSLKTINVDEIEDVIKELYRQRIGIRLENFVPSGSPTDRALQDLRMQSELFRLGQFQFSG